MDYSIPYDFHGAMSAGHTPTAILDELASRPDAVPYDIDGARKAGNPDSAILQEIVSRQPQQPTNLLGAITTPEIGNKAHDLLLHLVPASVERGTAHKMDRWAQSAEDAGMPDVAQYLRNQINKDQLNAPSSQDAVAQNLKAGNYLQALGNLPSAIGESLPDIGSAALATAIPGGPVARLAANGVLGVADQFGPLARARAQANGHLKSLTDAQGNVTQVPDPTLQDKAIAFPAAAGLGALNSVGLGTGAGTAVADAARSVPLLGRLVPGGSIGNALGSSVVHGASDAAQLEAQRLATGLGTDQGVQQPGPADLAAQMAIGAGGRMALAGARRIGDSFDGTQTARGNAELAEQFERMTPDEQQTILSRAGARKAVLDELARQSDNPVKPSLNQAARAVLKGADGYKARINDLIDQWTDPDSESGVALAKDQAKDLRDLATQAANSQQSLSNDTIRKTIGDTDLPDDAKQVLARAISEMNMLSTAGVRSNDTSALGRVAGMFLEHAPIPGGPLVAKPAGMIANFLSQRMGLSDPVLIREGAKALKMLQAAGRPVPATREELMNAINESHTGDQTMAQLLADQGLDPANYGPNPATPSPELRDARSALLDLARQHVVGDEASTQAAARGDKPALTPADESDPITQKIRENYALQPDTPPIGERLPPWMYGVGRAVQEQLQLSGKPKSLNYALESLNTLAHLVANGDMPPEFLPALGAHKGPIVNKYYNMIRNQMLLRHGVDMRTLDAQYLRPTE